MFESEYLVPTDGIAKIVNLNVYREEREAQLSFNERYDMSRLHYSEDGMPYVPEVIAEYAEIKASYFRSQFTIIERNVEIDF